MQEENIEKELRIRKMDDKGKVPIPEEIQKKLGIKKSELPSFEVILHREEKEAYIGLHPIKK